MKQYLCFTACKISSSVWKCQDGVGACLSAIDTKFEAQTDLTSGSDLPRNPRSSLVITSKFESFTSWKQSSIARRRMLTSGSYKPLIFEIENNFGTRTSSFFLPTFKQSSTVLRCLWTAFWSNVTVFCNVVSAT